jgi:hypothetical protein
MITAGAAGAASRIRDRLAGQLEPGNSRISLPLLLSVNT